MNENKAPKVLDKTAIIVLLVTFGFMAVYNHFILPAWYPPRKNQPQVGNVTTQNADKPIGPVVQQISAADGNQDIADEPSKKEDEPEVEPQPRSEPQVELPTAVYLLEDLVLELPHPVDDLGNATDKLRATFTNKGAALTHLEILDYKERSHSKDPLSIVEELSDGVHSLVLQDRDKHLNLDEVNYVHEAEKLKESPALMSFVTQPSPGLTVRKVFWLEEGAHHMKMGLEISNQSQLPVSLNLQLRGAAGIPSEVPVCGAFDQRTAPPGIHTFAFASQRKQNGDIFVEKEAHSAIEKHLRNEGKPMEFLQHASTFVGSMNRYFAVALIAPEDVTDWSRSSIFEPVGVSHVSASLQSAKLEIDPGYTKKYEFTVYAGPLKSADLDLYGELTQIYDLGWFTGISNLLHLCLDFFHYFTKDLPGVIGGYGLAIIFLTFMVRGMLHPLNRKAQVSMHGMSKLGPELTKLKDKYGEDKQRYQQEMMGLYKEHKVNPAGGCLPMILQFPVFIALYRVIQSSIALRGETFLWMADLSKPDALLCLPFNLPLLGESLNLLPLMMVALWIFQQKLTPKNTTDPQQAQMQKMMMYMPVVFGFMFYGMPSGLVLYFVTSSSLGIIESKVIKKALADKDGVTTTTESGVTTTSPAPSRPSGRIVPKKKKKRDKFGR